MFLSKLTIMKLFKHTQKNIIEKTEAVGKSGLVYYLPNHAVIKNKRETTKGHI